MFGVSRGANLDSGLDAVVDEQHSKSYLLVPQTKTNETTCCISGLGPLPFVNQALSQTTFTGAISQDWGEEGNWFNGLPAIGNDANIPADKTTIIYSDSLAIPFVVENSGTILINYGTVYITGALNNFGAFYNGQDQSTNTWIYNEGVITVYEGTFTNRNGFNNGELGVIVNYDNITNKGLLENDGAVENESSGIILNYSGGIWIGGSLVNNGTLENRGAVGVSSISVNPEGVVENNGLILNEDDFNPYDYNWASFYNNGTLNNNNDGTISNYSYLSNTGTINQCGSWNGFEPDLSNKAFLPYTTDNCTSAVDESALAFLMFPNPTRNELTLQLQGSQQMASIQIKDAAGRSVLKMDKVATGNTITLGLSSLRPGVYSVQVSCGLARAVRS